MFQSKTVLCCASMSDCGVWFSSSTSSYKSAGKMDGWFVGGGGDEWKRSARLSSFLGLRHTDSDCHHALLSAFVLVTNLTQKETEEADATEWMMTMDRSIEQDEEEEEEASVIKHWISQHQQPEQSVDVRHSKASQQSILIQFKSIQVPTAMPLILIPRGTSRLWAQKPFGTHSQLSIIIARFFSSSIFTIRNTRF